VGVEKWELRRKVRHLLNKHIDGIYHPQDRWIEDFLWHYVVEKATGLSDDIILKKALRYYRR